MSGKQNEYVALSGYCKEKGLSVPKTLAAEVIAEDFNIEPIPTGYKFKRSDLDVVVPKLGLKPIRQNYKIPKYLHIYIVNNTELLVFVNQEIGARKERKIIEAFDDDIILEEIELDENRPENGAAIISALKTLEDEVYQTGRNKDFNEILGKVRFEVFFTLKNDLVSDIVNKFKKNR